MFFFFVFLGGLGGLVFDFWVVFCFLFAFVGVFSILCCFISLLSFFCIISACLIGLSCGLVLVLGFAAVYSDSI